MHVMSNENVLFHISNISHIQIPLSLDKSCSTVIVSMCLLQYMEVDSEPFSRCVISLSMNASFLFSISTVNLIYIDLI